MARILIVAILKPMSRLPLSVLYIFSDVLFFSLYYLLPYRKKVVIKNLQNSFPDKNKKEIRKICRKFYKHLCDLLVETIKIPGLNEREARKRFTVENPEELNKYYALGKNMIVIGGHYNNWELAAAVTPLYLKHDCLGIYRPLKNEAFNQYIAESRSKFGLQLIPKKGIVKHIHPSAGKKPFLTFFLSDQVPKKSSSTYWTQFLNQETGVPVGGGVFANRYQYPVVYGQMTKEKRGHYKLRFKILDSEPQSSSPEEILEKFTRELENQILHRPEFWLWTHKRWKRKRPKEENSSN